MLLTKRPTSALGVDYVACDKIWTGLDWLNMDWIDKTWINKKWRDKTWINITCSDETWSFYGRVHFGVVVVD